MTRQLEPGARRRQDARAARAAISDQLRLEGVRVAYERGIALLKDDRVPATAHASLVRVMFQAANLLGAPDDEATEKELHEMTGEELSLAAAEAVARLSVVNAATEAPAVTLEELPGEDPFG